MYGTVPIHQKLTFSASEFMKHYANIQNDDYELLEYFLAKHGDF